VSLLAVVAVAVVALPAASEEGPRELPKALLAHLSYSAVSAYYIANPDQAPPRFAAAVDRMNERQGQIRGGGNHNRQDLFNRDIFGLPQNEESVTACRANINLVLEGTNDYRGLLDPEENFTGWHFSTDSGKTLRNEGLLPPVSLLSEPDREVPSGGDPVDFLSGGACDAYAASLAYNPANPFGDANGIAVYKSTPALLASCDTEFPNSSNPACWPVRRLVAEAAPEHFLDKEWMYVGVQNGVRYVWVTYSDFAIDETAPLGFTGAEIFAVRCDENLVTCTAPIPISVDDGDVQFSDVTVGPDGRAYITWSQILGELEQTDQTFVHKIRVETAPGSAVFGPEQTIYEETNAIPFGGFMHANDWRVATYPKNDVARLQNGTIRKFLIWDACQFRLLGTVCEEAQIKLSWSDDPAAATWTDPIVVSKGGDNYFPTIALDPVGRDHISMAWFTNRFDTAFHNQQDVVLTSVAADSPRPTGYKRLTGSSNESEADPLLGGFFIGDYIEAFTHANRVWVGYNANYRKVALLGVFTDEEGNPIFPGIPVNQQDNYLARTGPG
jgi:hypothetical protein